uniref:Secreted protein n=1 Tax=Steinernema glaseri TaxID=37863 RepID=A0A1I8AJN7_9BILA
MVLWQSQLIVVLDFWLLESVVCPWHRSQKTFKDSGTSINSNRLMVNQSFFKLCRLLTWSTDRKIAIVEGEFLVLRKNLSPTLEDLSSTEESESLRII